MANGAFFDTTVGKTFKVALYLGLSAVVGYLYTAAQGNPELFGQYTVYANLVLVFLKNLLDANTKNLPS